MFLSYLIRRLFKEKFSEMIDMYEISIFHGKVKNVGKLGKNWDEKRKSKFDFSWKIFMIGTTVVTLYLRLFVT